MILALYAKLKTLKTRLHDADFDNTYYIKEFGVFNSVAMLGSKKKCNTVSAGVAVRKGPVVCLTIAFHTWK